MLWRLQHKAARLLDLTIFAACHRYRWMTMFQFKVTMWSVIDDSMSFSFWIRTRLLRMQLHQSKTKNCEYWRIKRAISGSLLSIQLLYWWSSRKAFLTDKWSNARIWNLLVQVIFLLLFFRSTDVIGWFVDWVTN